MRKWQIGTDLNQKILQRNGNFNYLLGIPCCFLAYRRVMIFKSNAKKLHLGPSLKYVLYKEEEGSRQKRTSIVFMTSFYCLKMYKRGEGSENHQIWAYVFYRWSPCYLDIRVLHLQAFPCTKYLQTFPWLHFTIFYNISMYYIYKHFHN